MNLLEQYGSDAVRYWAVSGRPGTDTAFDEGQMKVGRRLAIKLLNASKFALGHIGEDAERSAEPEAVTAALDRGLLAELATLIADATACFDEYDYARALERTEHFFWGFCDDYVELVKQRAYGAGGDDGAASARAALAIALETLLRLFAPHLPFVTEEVWSWWQEGSVHRSAWPDAAPVRAAAADGDVGAYEVAANVLGEVRKAKAGSKRSLKTAVTRLVVRSDAALLAHLDMVQADVCEAARADALELVEADGFAVEVDLAEPEEA
jgi:valyl-tRNA synthetase